jgi:hypothetical protein
MMENGPLIVQIFEACGHDVTDRSFVDSDEGVVCFV